jgi:hypothetical protein
MVTGAFCEGIADDRGLRWSPDGAWLAITSPAQRSHQDGSGGQILDVVGTAGGRDPRLSALIAKLGSQAETLGAGAAGVWMDWSPSQRFLAVQDRAGELSVYDFDSREVRRLGPGLRPLWSPGGSYLLAMSKEAAQPQPSGVWVDVARQGFVFSMANPGTKIALGPARAARWLPPDACRRDP